MNRLNKYVQILELEGKHFLFNLANEKVFALHPTLMDLVLENKNSIDNIASIHPELYEQMVNLRMIVPQEMDETEEMIDSWKKADANPEHFAMIINPTLDCNLRCWYCYEKHEEKSMMNEKTLSAVYKLIEDKVINQGIKSLDVSFFGGEPLLCYKEVVFPILNHATHLCHEYNVKISSHFTTNATLLTDEMIKELNALDFTTPIGFQITLDGSKNIHNKVRVSPIEKNTYDTILHNVQSLLANGNQVYLRFNYASYNIESFRDVLSELKNVSLDERKRLNVNFQQIWQDKKKHPEIQQRAVELADEFKENDFKSDSDTFYFRHVCYADLENHIVINYDGNVYKCTARTFTDENKEGVLNPDGSITWNEKYAKRMAIKYSNQACRKCKIMPICNGGCSQNKMDSGCLNDKCYRGFGSKDKADYISHRLYQILQDK